jgi:hypothetical protein
MLPTIRAPAFRSSSLWVETPATSARGSGLAWFQNMQPIPNLFGRASAVEADHAHLRETWTRLRRLAGKQQAEAQPGAELWPLILEFGRELREHFTAEEAGDYFGALAEEQPQLRSQIDHLRGEHREIVALLNELEAAAGSGSVEFGSRLNQLLSRFQQHEGAEAKLLQDFFGRDEGGEGS